MSKTIVLDPGHGGITDLPGSGANHAISAGGVEEKVMTLDMARRVRSALAQKSPDTRVLMTRDADVNVSGADRAAVAKNSGANLFLSIHFNGFDKHVRGVETFVRAASNGNINESADMVFAQRVQTAVLAAIRRHQPQAPNRGVKRDCDVGFAMAVLSDLSLGNIHDPDPCLACLVEIEFIDNPEVDKLLNGPGGECVRSEIADSIADALLAQLGIALTGPVSLARMAPEMQPVSGSPSAAYVEIPRPDVHILRSQVFARSEALEAVAAGHRVLRATGSRVAGVELVQDALNKLAIVAPEYRIKTGAFRGFFGQKTERAVEAFQEDMQLTVDGIVGEETIRALDEVMVRQERGLDALPHVTIAGRGGVAAETYVPPVVNAALLSGIDFKVASVVPGRQLAQAFAKADMDPRLAKGDPSNCKALLRFPDGTVFFDAKMAICADGSPRAAAIDPPYGNCETAISIPGTQNEFLNAEHVPYIVLPLPSPNGALNFTHAFGIGPRDLAVVVHGGRLTAAFYGEKGPWFRLGEAAINVHENLPVPSPWTSPARNRVRNASVRESVLYFVFPGSAVPRAEDMTPGEWLEETQKKALEKWEGFRQGSRRVYTPEALAAGTGPDGEPAQPSRNEAAISSVSAQQSRSG